MYMKFTNISENELKTISGGVAVEQSPTCRYIDIKSLIGAFAKFLSVFLKGSTGSR